MTLKLPHEVGTEALAELRNLASGVQVAHLVWCAGHTVYHGPREEIMDFFNSLGFRLPPRKDPASFLQEVTSVKDQEVHPLLFSVSNPEDGCM